MKRILSLDGGGVRSFFTLQVLEQVEAILRERKQDSNYRLCQHFDLIAGTSAGAIIGTLLSWGLTVAEVKQHYHTCIHAVFEPASFTKVLKHKYTDKYIATELRRLFREKNGQDALFGSDHLKTLLLIVLRNATTGSPWPLCNNPKAKFNDRALPDCNLNLPLWQLVRASSAAPTFFPCEKIQLGDKNFEFIDGGISPYNNPSFLVYQMATLPCYRLEWETGLENLYLLSIGVGQIRPQLPKSSHLDMHLLDHAPHVIDSLMYSSSVQQDLACRTVGNTTYGAPIDLEIGDLVSPDHLPNPHFRYTRHNMKLDSAQLTLDETNKLGKKGYTLDNIELISHFERIGQTYANEYVQSDQIC